MENRIPSNKYFLPPSPSPSDLSIYERDEIVHGHCNCCTSVEQSNRFQDEYRKKIAELRKVEGKSWRLRAKAKLVDASADSSSVTKAADDWTPYPTTEDWEAEK